MVYIRRRVDRERCSFQNKWYGLRRQAENTCRSRGLDSCVLRSFPTTLVRASACQCIDFLSRYVAASQDWRLTSNWFDSKEFSYDDLACIREISIGKIYEQVSLTRLVMNPRDSPQCRNRTRRTEDDRDLLW